MTTICNLTVPKEFGLAETLQISPQRADCL